MAYSKKNLRKSEKSAVIAKIVAKRNMQTVILFFQICSPKVIKIGLSFYEAEAQKIEASSLDVPLDYCVTPEKVYRF